MNLTIVPSVKVFLEGDDIVFDRKFYDGMLVYIKEWDGTISCVIKGTEIERPLFGSIRMKRNEIPFHLEILTESEKVRYEHLKKASIVLSSGDSFDQLHISRICKKQDIKCVYIIEYTLETRYQILNLERLNCLKKLRRHFFLWNSERKREIAFGKSNGLQANGMAAYDEYSCFRNCMLYFDTRVHSNDIISRGGLSVRLAKMLKNKPLRLGFSGRLIKMKGADQLILLASVLKQNNVKFHMTIYGCGDLENNMMDEISYLSLAEEVCMAGKLDFYDELLPEIKKNIDLFVILHRQGDPSCTYLETLSCGVPIVGYENKAFSGLLMKADVGWGKSIDDIYGVAKVIEYLDVNRQLIADKSKNSLIFSQSNSFEKTFHDRVKHLQDLCRVVSS